MKLRCTSFIFFFVLFEHCTLMTWSASDENNQDRPLERRAEWPWKRFLNLKKSESGPNESREDRKGKGIAVENSSAVAESSSAGESKRSSLWNNKQNKELSRYFYAYRNLGASKGKDVRDWYKIMSSLGLQQHKTEKEQIKSRAFYLRDKMHRCVGALEGGIEWTDELNDELMRIYYTTEEGDMSKHGERMHVEWMRMKYPGYEHITPKFMLNRAEKMLRGLGRITVNNSNQVNTNKSSVPGLKQHDDWWKDVDTYLIDTWSAVPMNVTGRSKKIYREAVTRYPRLREVGLRRMYAYAKRLYSRMMQDPKTLSELKKKASGQKQAYKFIVDGNINWRAEHDDFLMKLWNNLPGDNATECRSKTIYRAAAQKFTEFHELSPDQVYSRVKYMRKKARQARMAMTQNRESMSGTHIQYHTFMDDQMILPMYQRTNRDHEWIASTSSQQGPSHQQPDLELGLKTPDSEGQSPDTNLKLR